MSQPSLIDLLDTSTTAVELFPEVWKLAEEMIAPEPALREKAIDKLVALNAPRFSPLIAYLFASKISEPLIELRYQIVVALGDVLTPDKDGLLAPEKTRGVLKNVLSRMRRREIYSLLQVVEKYPPAEASVESLLNSCSFGGNALAELFSDRTIPVAIRKQAIRFSGIVGYLDTIAPLEKLIRRLETHRSGQRKMSFAPLVNSKEEQGLLDAAYDALQLLKA